MRFLLQFYFGLINLTSIVGFMGWEVSLNQVLKNFQAFLFWKNKVEKYLAPGFAG